MLPPAVFLASFALTSLAADGSAGAMMQEGLASFEGGRFEEAIQHWERAAKSHLAQRNLKGQIEALVNLGAAHSALGQQQPSLERLREALDLATKLDDKPSLVLVRSSLGRAYASARRVDLAEPHLREALELARAGKDQPMVAAIDNDLGNLLAEQDKVDEALERFREADEIARGHGDALLSAKALCNAAATCAVAGRDKPADEFNSTALDQIAGAPASHEKALVLTRCGQTDWLLAQRNAEGRERLLTRAEKSYRDALQVAEPLSDHRAMTYALGYLGQVCESRGQWDKALELTRQAAFLAQGIPSSHALYRWEWQTARVLKAKNDSEAALQAYRRALQTLGQVRQDLTAGCFGRAAFRDSVGPVFFEMADLLLRKAKAEQDKPARERLLREARDTIEQLKSAELEDYFRDECANVVLTRAAKIEQVARDTAVVYIIPLPDRTELLLGFSSGFEQFQAPVGAKELTEEVRKFRFHLEKRTTEEYRLEAQKLHQWLIAPIEPVLRTHNVKTLVFVPDGALRNIPMAALHDGERFLVERFAIAVSPGLALLEPKPIQRENAEVLLAGLSEGVQDFPPLPYVPSELENVEKLFRSRTLLNEQFRLANLEQNLRQSQYQVVHFASHGEFDRDASKNFILAYDQRLTLDQLEALIRPSQFRGKPVELLALSACQTAAGDDRAALGLAGVAVKAGARSAFATLWFVNDESTASLVQEFYAQLRGAKTTTKAEALQQAQRKLLRDPRYQHPCYWAAYLIIGNWL